MKALLSSGQKREYLRRFLAAGSVEAARYLADVIGPRDTFESLEEMEQYKAETGYRLGKTYIIGRPPSLKLAAFYEELYELR